ncbi:hypothetical protein QMK19_15980 [Streptomyces sp. H10-C2]|uniref:hypothetical protein n=1 Tax=unclassified Streptomyces TaxID=2593676 RepID=UPI0024BA7C9D|nr:MULTISPECIES: hypothetical protein [unclassified Streptomyces]MDJ0346194.1 hypothetical protein [Streptomyces sp. PH10-H1]MDJ0371145.1 hypothetical protein [Streptomyces sp. H10-C2]
MEDSLPVVVFPPVNGARRVRIRGEDVGRAYRLADLLEFLRRAGMDEQEIEETKLIDWRGGGPEKWAG